MRIEITYIHHNCFVLQAEGRTLLFDYPSAQHLSQQAAALVRAKIKNTDLYVFASHSHEDHFTPAIHRFEEQAANVHFVLSYDIVELFEEFDPEHADNVTVAEPEERCHVAGMDIDAFESTDLGVGFTITLGGRRIYYGGDVAEWVWDSQEEAAKTFSRRHYTETLERVQAGPPVDVAFSNADKRLSNWAGGVRFVREVAPTVFVPMHTFGNVQWLPQFAREVGQTDTQLFIYREPGDMLRVTV